MIAPLYKTGFFGREAGIICAMLLGFLFGFFLEKAGFGSSKKLSDVWYGRDFAVIKVMFTAVITSTLGLFGAFYLGFLDLDLVYINTTYLWPQITGAFIFGIGFAVGGYCPGTVAVATVTGKIDGIVFMLGFMGGVLIFSEVFSLIENFYNSGYLGRVFLNEVFGIPLGLMAAFIIVFALGAFLFLKWLELFLRGGGDKT